MNNHTGLFPANFVGFAASRLAYPKYASLESTKAALLPEKNPASESSTLIKTINLVLRIIGGRGFLLCFETGNYIICNPYSNVFPLSFFACLLYNGMRYRYSIVYGSEPMSQPPHFSSQEEKIQYYKKQRQAREYQRRRQQAKRKVLLIMIVLAMLLILLVVKGCGAVLNALNDTPASEAGIGALLQSPEIQVGDMTFKRGYVATETDATTKLDDTYIDSSHAILINPSDNTIVAEKDPYKIVSPASMTKVLTILVAAEQIENLDDTFTITREITDYSFSHDCSVVGFEVGETVPVRDLFYGTILPSGADAALGLAIYTAGSEENFAVLMNQKLEDLGLSDSAHFTNCVGLYDQNHYCTAYDMAMIMKAALENDFCREVLNTRVYTTAITPEHPEGLTISNWFMRRIEDKETIGTVMGAKTGFVKESGNCAVSYYISSSNIPYIAVTIDTYSSWKCIYDHVALYNYYAP